MRDPSFAVLYGDLKAGKTADALAAFPQGVYVAAPGALAPAEKVWGFEVPKGRDLETFKDIAQFAVHDLNGASALIIDDATLIADRTANYLLGKGIGGYDLWALVLSQAIHMRDALRRRGIHIVFTCHPRAAHNDNGVRMRGGPSFQGQCAMKIPAAADLLLRAEARAGSDGLTSLKAIGWSWMYRTTYSPDWLQGSRFNTPDMAPMNLGEILRLAGYTIPRLPGLEWQESLADALARRLCQVGLGDEQAVKDSLARVLDKAMRSFTKSEAHAYWALRDGYDRAVLWTAQAVQRRTMWGI